MDPSKPLKNDLLNLNPESQNAADKSSTFISEEQNSSGLYDSAVENLTNGSTIGSSLNGSLFYDLPNNTTLNSSSGTSAAFSDRSPNKNSTLNTTQTDTTTTNTTSDNTINNSSIADNNINMMMNVSECKSGDIHLESVARTAAAPKSLSYGNSNGGTINAAAMNANAMFLQSESTDTNNSSLDEVDPKSQLANKTIFKSDNPNLSIIEINDNSIKEEQDAVVLIQSLSEDDSLATQSGGGDSNSNTGPNVTHTTINNAEETTTNNTTTKSTDQQATTADHAGDNAADKRRKRAECLLQSSKQKIDLAIAEASAAADTTESKPAGSTALIQCNGDIPVTKREIVVYDTIEEFEQKLPSTVTVLDTPFGSRVYLVGTAHFSEESQDDVSFVIRNVRPDVVMVELCPSRIHILKLDEKTLLEEAKSFNLAKIRGILHAHGYINGIFFILLLQMSAQIAKDLGMAPGGEFRRAFEEIHRLPGCMLHLGDRPIRITLHRALRALSLWQTMKLVWRLTSTDTISIEEVEECKQRDLLEKLMQEMAGEFPAFSDVFVKERDLFLCHSLQLAALPQTPPGSAVPRPVRVVGVVGIGHAKGIAQMWGRVDPQKIPEIMDIPPASLSTRIAKYTVKYGLIGLTLYGAFRVLRPRFARLF